VLAAAIAQVPARMRRKLLVRVDGAGASHDLITHLLSLATAAGRSRRLTPEAPHPNGPDAVTSACGVRTRGR
jgi:hypothetical protein